MDKQYRINEIFYSLQGEGSRAGEASLFIRFTGCNMRCDIEPGTLSPGGFACDTEFMSGRKMTASEIVRELKVLSYSCKWIVLTGGEPALQLTQDLADTLHEAGYSLAIETNGTVAIDEGLLIDHITVSPKCAEHAIRQRSATEVKYVRGYGQGIPETVVDADYYYISPAHDGLELDQRTLQWCIRLCRENPLWRLSVQQHKAWRAR